jgi:hypothetical protein
MPSALVSATRSISGYRCIFSLTGTPRPQRVYNASDAMAAALEKAFETTAATAGDHTATTTRPAGTSALDTTDDGAGLHGGPRGDRTHNPRIKSPLLCQLS